ncbi:MAG TPA: hypothetical protein VFU15_08155 [Bacteroidia bacterium]|nr:hypothetical protein [Bacteroidia bacterium]
MKPLPEVIRSLKAKTEKMLALSEALKKENIRLASDIGRLKNRVEELEAANRLLEEKYKDLRIAGKVSGDTDRNLALKLRINELVREIDKVIAQLNR